jgi:hypothetical protein
MWTPLKKKSETPKKTSPIKKIITSPKSSNYVASLKTIWHHTALAYKNFIHWNFSKLCIYFKTFVIAFILNIPLLLIAAGVLVYMQSSLSEKEISDLLSGGIESIMFLQNHIWTALFMGILVFISISLLIFALSYSWFLFAELSEKYSKGEDTPFIEGGWWRWNRIKTFVRWETKKFTRFTRVFAWISLWISIPGIIAFIIYLTLFGLTESGYIAKESTVWGYILGYGSLLAAGIFIVGTLYLLLRYMYAPLLLLENDWAEKNGREISKLSWELTRKKVLHIFLTLLPFVIILGVLKLPLVLSEQEIKVENMSKVIQTAQKNNPDTFENDHVFVQTQLLALDNLNETDLSNIIAIWNAYNPQTTEINKDYIREMLPYIEKSGTMDDWKDISITLIFGLFGFLFFSSIESQFLYGSYKDLRQGCK